jgi:hypothetical protein
MGEKAKYHIMEDLTVATIDRVIELAPAKLLNVDGYVHIDKNKSVQLFTPPTPSHLAVSRLTGLVDLLESGFESYPVADTLVHVVSHEMVDVISRASDRWGRRQTYVRASLQKAEREFTFNQYIPQENFIIALRSLFLQDSQLDDLVRIAGNLASGSEIRQQDDGFTQQATVKAGVIMVAERTILPRVMLTPFRTFREVKQPSSEYVFRVKGDDKVNYCALFEADGGTWKLLAIDNIKEWLSNQLKGSTVERLPDMPIVA